MELGQRNEGVALLEGVVRDFPLSYYMMHAYARLLRLDAPRARATLRDALASEPQGDFVIPFHPELAQPAFLRAIELVRQGDGDSALVELETLGVRERTAHPSLLWASAFVLARIEAPTASHGLLRGSTDLWQEHYPVGVWRPVWEVAYPRAFRPVIELEAKKAQMPEHLLYAVMREESAFDPRAVSVAGAHGLMQLIVPTAQAMSRSLGLTATPTSLKRPEVNVALGSRYLANLTRKFDYNPLLAVPGYNADPGAPERWVSEHPADDFDVWVERIPYTETRQYTKRVLASMAAYAMLYGSGMDAALVVPPLAVQP
jgi:soluble lytic murein transglycosylase